MLNARLTQFVLCIKNPESAIVFGGRRGHEMIVAQHALWCTPLGSCHLNKQLKNAVIRQWFDATVHYRTPTSAVCRSQSPTRSFVAPFRNGGRLQCRVTTSVTPIKSKNHIRRDRTRC